MIDKIIEKALVDLYWRRASFHKKPKTPSIGLSKSGDCVRKLGYYLAGYPQSAWGWRQSVTLDDGTRGHTVIRKDMIRSLENSHFSLIGQEREVILRLGEHSWKGHVDGIIQKMCGLDSSIGECKDHTAIKDKTLLEVKTSGASTFKSLEKDGISYSYRCQANAYMHATGIHETLFLFKDKGTGKLWSFLYEFDHDIMDEVAKRLLASTEVVTKGLDPQNLAREYGPDEKGKLPFECSYCPFIKECWKDNEPVQVMDDPVIFRVKTF